MIAIAAGIVISLSLPPFGWWPLGVLGLAGLAALIWNRSLRRRVVIGAAAGLGQYAVGLWWVTEFNLAGYGVLVLLGMAFTAAAVAVVPARRHPTTLLTLPAALMVTDWGRGHFPLGGLPLGGLALGQAAGPLAPAARLGGALLVVGVTTATGVGAAVVAMAVVRRTSVGRSATFAGLVLALVAAVVVGGRLGPDGSGSGDHRVLRVASVQGGGPRGLHAAATDRSVVFQRQLDAAAGIIGPVDLVVWPEDGLQVGQPVGQTLEGVAIGQLAHRLGATVVAGVVEDVGLTRFRNAAVAWAPTGVIVGRYDKVHRVPFGEYVPGRSLIAHLADLALVPRDAIAGRGPGLLDTPAGRLGTVISYEVFFEERARAAIRSGGEVLLVPTNASSYVSSQVPTQEVAAAQLRAWETGRDAIQAAPTGYSAVIDHDGRVVARSTLGGQQIVTGTVTLRRGQTLFTRLGETPLLVLALLSLVAAAGLALGRN